MLSGSSARSKCCHSCVRQAGVCMGLCCLEVGFLFTNVRRNTESWGHAQCMLLLLKRPHRSFTCVFVSPEAAAASAGGSHQSKHFMLPASAPSLLFMLVCHALFSWPPPAQGEGNYLDVVTSQCDCSLFQCHLLEHIPSVWYSEHITRTAVWQSWSLRGCLAKKKKNAEMISGISLQVQDGS